MTDIRPFPAAADAMRHSTAELNAEQNRASFYLTGRRMATGLSDIAGLGLLSAQFAPYRRLHELRYDYPLILVHGGDVRAAVRSLSGMMDEILAVVAVGDDAARIRHHAMLLEQEIRGQADRGVDRLSSLWARAEERLVATAEDPLLADSLAKLVAARQVEGDVVACTQETPGQVVGHLWKQVQRDRIGLLSARITQLRQALADILAAEQADSPTGLASDRLAQSLGPVFGAELDVSALSRLLTDNRPRFRLSDARRERVRGLLDALARQRFVPVGEDADGGNGELYEFVYSSPDDAIAAYRDRFAATAELAKSLVIAEMEADGRYREDIHDPLFAKWDVEDLEADILGMFPDYLVRVDAEVLTARDSVVLLEALAAGIPIKVLVQVNDLLRGTSSADRHPGDRLSTRKLARYALASGESFVLQAPSAGLFQMRERIVDGSMAPGAALFVVYSGGGQWLGDLPPYLASAAATEARVFPAFTYDPAAGDTWADRFTLAANPQAERDWPVHCVSYADAAMQRVRVEAPFTAADFWAGDSRMLPHLALSSLDGSEGTVVPFAEHLATAPGIWADQLPYLLMVSADESLHRVLVDRPLVHRTQRDLEQWRRLQELGGIHNSHVARELARQRDLFDAEIAQLQAGAALPAAGVAATAAPSDAPPALAEPEDDLNEPEARDPYLPWIETSRCSTCNECTLINDRMFAYNENRQAYIADPDAGTYAELVEAAENCQVAIIHPAKPRDPAEPGLEELIKRAEAFA
ncbi:MAG: hypothetical protein V9G19_19695 [Tetrasphaera sp.]